MENQLILIQIQDSREFQMNNEKIKQIILKYDNNNNNNNNNNYKK